MSARGQFPFFFSSLSGIGPLLIGFACGPGSWVVWGPFITGVLSGPLFSQILLPEFV